MSYQVLARKYRPKNFHELVGQTHVSQALTNAIDQDRLHHAYLFTGTRGVGKTTIARILAKCLNCETGVTSAPCGTCSACTAIDAGRFIDLIEIDAASRTKVEDTRELLDNVPYAPSQGRYKVYLIDEVHMLSTHSFNALLKTLEEPPPHVKFLLATTDPQKLPITIISRCLQFVLRPLPRQAIFDHLVAILAQEHIDYEKPALWQLADAAKGSLRDALSLTDQAIGFGNRQVSLADVTTMLGSINTADLWALLKAIYQQDKASVSQTIEQLRMQLIDAKAILDAIAERLHQLALWQLLPELTFDLSADEQQQLAELGELMLPQSIQLYYEIVLQARDSLKMANTPMQGLEMCLLRLLAFRPFTLEDDTTTNNVTTINTTNSEKKNADITQTLVVNTSANSQTNAQETAVTVANQQVAVTVEEQPQANKILVEKPADLTNTDMIHGYTANDEDTAEYTNKINNLDKHNPNVDAVPVVHPPTTSVQHNTQVECAHDDGVQTLVTDSTITQTSTDLSHKQHLADILACPEATLTGEWTLGKWEYWLVNAQLGDMERNLATNGVMQGQIDGLAQFVIEPQYETVAKQRLGNLQERLKQDFSQTQVKLSISKQPLDVPKIAITQRYQKALQVANTMLMQEPIIQQLIKDFQAEITDISLH